MLLATLRSSPRKAAAFGVLCFLPLLWLAYTFRRIEPARHGILDIYYLHGAMPLLRCFAGFTLGLLAYRVSRIDGVMRLARRPVTGLVVVVTLLLALAMPRTDLLIELLFPALVLVVYAETTPVARAFGSRVPYILGVWSYSIYLVHPRLIGPEMRLQRLLVALVGPAGGAWRCWPLTGPRLPWPRFCSRSWKPRADDC